MTLFVSSTWTALAPVVFGFHFSATTVLGPRS